MSKKTKVTTPSTEGLELKTPAFYKSLCSSNRKERILTFERENKDILNKIHEHFENLAKAGDNIAKLNANTDINFIVYLKESGFDIQKQEDGEFHVCF